MASTGAGSDPEGTATASPPGAASEGSGNWRSRETLVALMAAAGLAAFFVSRFVLQVPPEQGRWILLAVLAIGGTEVLAGLVTRVVAGELGSDLLAGIAIVTSAVVGEYLAGAIIVLMLSGGVAIEQYATRRASAVLSALAKRMPRTAHRRTATGLEEISLDSVGVGDQLVVLPHEICPVDGTVVEGRGSMDESYLTGEPYQVSKVVGTPVLSGAINGEGALTIEAVRRPVDSRYAKIMQVMKQAESDRPQFRRVADRLGAWYTLLALAVAALGWWLGNDPARFLAVLVIATPCPLLLAIPVAIIGAISAAASRAIIVKNPAMLERIAGCRTVIFDKTGTLTYGKPVLTETLCAPGIDPAEALRLAASLEEFSKHPLAASIREAAASQKLGLVEVSEINEKPGEGLTARAGARLIQILGRKQLATRPEAVLLPPAAPGMECILLIDRAYAATFRFRDTPRQESRSFIRHLGPKHQVNRVMLLSGDRESEVVYLAQEVGITEALFGQSPEQKVDIVRREAALAPTMFLGDGINDAPAMQAATVGIAFGQNSDVTAEAADAVVLDASLGKVDELIHIALRMRRIALESAVGGMALSMIGMGLAAAGLLTPVAGAIAQEVIDVAAVLNAVRVALPSDELGSDAG